MRERVEGEKAGKANGDQAIHTKVRGVRNERGCITCSEITVSWSRKWMDTDLVVMMAIVRVTQADLIGLLT